MSANIQGFVSKGYEPVLNQFKSNFDQGLEHGASLCVERGGETIINLWGGYADRAKTILWQENSLVQFFSATKPLSAANGCCAYQALASDRRAQ
jgi:CubicO group peptidase (beta-lactamase class C family)